MVETNRAEGTPLEKLTQYFEQQLKLQRESKIKYTGEEAYFDALDVCKNAEKQSQSEIDELTKEVERLRKGIDWTRAEYIKCVNDSDEITEKLEELLTTH